MTTLATKFMKGILGEDGEQAFEKMRQRAPGLGVLLAPRTVLGWLTTAARIDYEGEVPGIDKSYISLAKSDRGLNGVVDVDGDQHFFNGSDLLHVAATLSYALGIEDVKLDPGVKATDISKLGKSIDMLVQARVITKASSEDLEQLKRTEILSKWKDRGLNKKVLDPSHGYTFTHEHHDLGGGNFLTKVNVHAPTGDHVGAATFTHGNGTLTPGSVVVDDDHQRRGIATAMYQHAEKMTGKKLVPSANQTPEGAALWQANSMARHFGKQELPGMAAPSRKPEEPMAPQTPTKQPAMNLPPKPPMAKSKELVIKHEDSSRKCRACGQTQFNSGKFAGCLCFRALAKSVSTRQTETGYVLQLSGSDWDYETVKTLASTFRG